MTLKKAYCAAQKTSMQGERFLPEGGGNQTAGSPFDLEHDKAYERWREAKLAAYPACAADLVVDIGDLGRPVEAELRAVADLCRKANMAIYRCPRPHSDDACLRQDLLAFAEAFGLTRSEGHRSAGDDGIVALQVSRDAGREGYIPYTDKPLSWHTDGYYNAPEDRIGAFLLHCVRCASDGGENGFLDPDIAYIRLRDENPDFIAALTHEEAMTIPANVEDNGKVRPVSVGPVFFLHPQSGALQMRYTARTRSIVWRNDAKTQAAEGFLRQLLSREPLVFRHTLAPGEGVICNNVLHCRSRFDDGPGSARTDGRLLYRMRYTNGIGYKAPTGEIG
jgi:alpha-ketoglutarate-dependent taurine dioxygenase